MLNRRRGVIVAAALAVGGAWTDLQAGETVRHPFLGVTHIARTETSPRNLRMNIVLIDLTVPGLRFKLTPPGGDLEVVRQRTADYINQQQAQVGINSHFFLPFPSSSPFAMIIGLGASEGNVYSAFEAPVQSYALVTNVPAINIDPTNHASVVHIDRSFPDGLHVLEPVTLWNVVSGSGQTVTNGVKTIPMYIDAEHPDALLTPGGPANYSNANSWYNLLNARSAIGLTQDNKTLVLFTVDVRPTGVSQGMAVGEVADLLIRDYGVYNAFNIDGGGSTTMAMEKADGTRSIINSSSDNALGRIVASSLAVFADRDTVPPVTLALRSPFPNAYGWNNTPVDLTVNATDNHGGWVEEISYSLAGAQSTGVQIVPGRTASISIAEEGITTATYQAADEAGNQEAAHTLAVKIDTTAPQVSGLPAAGCMLTPANLRLRHVATIAAADAVSGVVAGSLQVTATSNEPAGLLRDVVIRPDGAGGIEVLLRAERRRRGQGRTYTIHATAKDLAGNVATSTATCTVARETSMP